jgi:hypothetical protein
LLLFAAIAAALLAVPAVARAQAPYPPTGPSSAPAASPGPSGSNSEQQSINNESGGPASTGFQTLTATGIAVALLGGGVALVVVGRRRRGAG